MLCDFETKCSEMIQLLPSSPGMLMLGSQSPCCEEAQAALRRGTHRQWLSPHQLVRNVSQPTWKLNFYSLPTSSWSCRLKSPTQRNHEKDYCCFKPLHLGLIYHVAQVTNTWDAALIPSVAGLSSRGIFWAFLKSHVVWTLRWELADLPQGLWASVHPSL